MSNVTSKITRNLNSNALVYVISIMFTHFEAAIYIYMYVCDSIYVYIYI
jgi:hypothetical protein